MMGQKVLELDIPLFVKWAGGKKQLLKSIAEHLPDEINSYYEPFIGGGAVFFFIKHNFNPEKAVISDINPELINAYKTIRDNAEELMEVLKIHKNNNSQEYYYKIRSLDPEKLNNLERAARLIYINKTCFNGLYRVNSKGGFNVPFGKYKNPSIFNRKRLLQASKLLQRVELRTVSYEKVLTMVKPGELVYLDPPYYPLNGNSFTTYTKNDFTKEDHVKLAELCKKLDRKGAKIILSNSHTPKVLELYSDFNINTVMAKRAINCNGDKRGAVKEVLVTNY